MKKTLTILSFTLIALSSFPQKYQPFPEKNAIWSSAYSTGDCMGVCSRNVYFIKGDVEIIDGKRYIPIYHGSIGPNGFDGPGEINMISHYGYIRNDTINKRVYKRLANENGDSLVYDFSINYTIGDTVDYNHDDEPVQITDIDSILIAGNWHKRINASDSNYVYSSLTEGFGMNTGFLSATWNTGDGFESAWWGDYKACDFSTIDNSFWPPTLCQKYYDIVGVTAYPQDYIPLVRSGVTWTHSFRDAEEATIMPCQRFGSVFITYITSDTIVYNNNIYFKLNNGKTGIREDSLKRVYILDLEYKLCYSDLPKEYLLFDFSLLNDSNTVTIDGVSRRYYRDSTNWNNKIVEGIGSLQGGLVGQCSSGLGYVYQLVCFQGDSINYASSGSKECGLCPSATTDTCDLSVEIDVKHDIYCSGSKRQTCTQGVIGLRIFGNGGPFTIEWVISKGASDVVPNPGLDSFSVMEPGEYYAIVTDSKGCIDTTDVVIILVNGIDDHQRQGIKFYPNPITDHAILTLDRTTDFTVQLFDVQGRLVMEQDGRNTNTMEIDRGSLEPGIYFYRLGFDDGRISKGKIMMQ